MKSIKELELLVKFAKALGETPDPEMVAKVQEHYEFQKKLLESVRANAANDLNSAFGTTIIKEDKNELVQQKTEIERSTKTNPAPPQSDLRENTERNKETNKTDTDYGRQPAGETLADLAAKFISEAPKDSFQQPDVLVVPNDMDAVRGKLKFLEQWLSKVSSAGPGSGEVNLRRLDDVNRANILADSVLFYNDTTKKFDFQQNRTFGSFYDTTQQVYANVNLGQYVSINTDAGSKNVKLESNGTIRFDYTGTYNINYSLQFTNTDSNQFDINVWLKQNGSNIPDSNSIFTIPGRKNPSRPGKIIAVSPIPVAVASNDYVQLFWHTDTTAVVLETIAAQGAPGPDIPRAPAVIVSVNKL